MTESLRNPSPRETELRQVNQRLSVAVSAIGRVAEAALRVEDLPEHIRSEVEHYAGQGIRSLVQDHLNTYLAGEGSTRGVGLDMGVRRGLVIHIDSGLMYDVPKSRRTQATEPVPDFEWFRGWQDILSQVTCLKYY